MIDIRKWNYETQQYEDYTPPSDNVVLYSKHMDLLVACASCGKDLIYGDSFTSKELHTSIGLGYPVCDACYKEELVRANPSFADFKEDV